MCKNHVAFFNERLRKTIVETQEPGAVVESFLRDIFSQASLLRLITHTKGNYTVKLSSVFISVTPLKLLGNLAINRCDDA